MVIIAPAIVILAVRHQALEVARIVHVESAPGCTTTVLSIIPAGCCGAVRITVSIPDHTGKAPCCTVALCRSYAEMPVQVAFESSARSVAIGVGLKDWRAAWRAEAVVSIITTDVIVAC